MSSYWSHPFNPPIKPKFQLDLGQGNTPLENISDIFFKTYSLFPKTYNLFIKREDLNPNGSFKDRALAYQISYIQQQGAKYCVLSSSGNAAISCASFCQKTNIKPIILISPDTPENKLSQIISRKPFLLIQSHQARRLAKYINKKYNIPILNPSIDKNASIGFETLGQEIHEQLPDCDAICSYSTSGASLEGTIRYYQKNNLTPPPAIAVQIYSNQVKEKELSAPKFYHHSNAKHIINLISQTKGSLQKIQEDQISDIQKFLKINNINSSFEGAACLTATKNFIESSFKIENPPIIPKNIVIIISGAEHQLIPIPQNYQIKSATSTQEINQILKNINIEPISRNS